MAQQQATQQQIAQLRPGQQTGPVTQRPPPAPRGYYRGPLPLPGRKPVKMDAYRKAAVRASQPKHRDQARDRYVLARNRRAQIAAERAREVPPVPQPEALPPPPQYEEPIVAPPPPAIGYYPTEPVVPYYEPPPVVVPEAPVGIFPGAPTYAGAYPTYGGGYGGYGGGLPYDAPGFAPYATPVF